MSSPQKLSGRVLLLGAAGMLGEAVYHTLAESCEVLATDLAPLDPWQEPLDIRNSAAVARVLREHKPAVTMNLAALVDLEYCETHADEAFATNALAAEDVARLAAEHQSALVYISTAGIYDGRKPVYHDYDPPNPLSVYGQAKYAGELASQACSPRHFVFRAGWMMGGGLRKDKKFVCKIVRQLQKGVDTLYVVDDKLGTPTYTWDFAANLARVVAAGRYGLYNMVSHGGCSRFEVAERIVAGLGLSDRVRVQVVESEHFAKEYFAPRPASEQLDNLKLRLRGLDGMHDWRDNLAKYLARYAWELDAGREGGE